MDSTLAYTAGVSAERNIQEGIRARERSQHETQLRRLRGEYEERHRALADTYNALVAEHNKLLGVLANQRQEIQELKNAECRSWFSDEAENCAGRLSMKEAKDLKKSGFSELFDSIEQAYGIQLDAAWREQAIAKVSAAYPLIFDASAFMTWQLKLRDELAKHLSPPENSNYSAEWLFQKMAKADAIAEPFYREFKKSRQI